ncbi:MAG: Ig-like domain-containing protein, partial [Deltaproteobacteria bacterium]|nr:Ig-like domain-containing protein [Deltaproteobacteria bacterium]
MKNFITNSLILTLVLGLLILPSAPGPQGIYPAQAAPGQSAILLPDGRWLMVGGEDATGPLVTVSIWDPRTGRTAVLSSELNHARAGHSVTMLPDGTIFILGGVDADGKVVHTAELFDPQTQKFEVLPSTGLTAHAQHTATLLPDGRLLVAGGVSVDGKVIDVVELWDPQTQSTETLPGKLHSARHSHSATLLSDGSVLLWGGQDKDGNTLNNGEIYDPERNTFTFEESEIQNPKSEILQLMASLPEDGSLDVPTDSIISLRFSHPLRVETINAEAVTLMGPKGVESAKVIPAEGGRLAFITPGPPLLPGATYTLTLNGLKDQTGSLLPLTGFSFTTKPSAVSAQQSATITSQSGVGASQSKIENLKPVLSEVEVSKIGGVNWRDEWEWKGMYRDGKPYSPWQDLPPLQARPGVTALAGQVLQLNGEPLANVTLEIEGMYDKKAKARTDKTGRFLLKDIMAGWCEVVIDGRRARRNLSRPENHGVFEYGLEIKEGKTNVLPFTIWLPKIDTAHAVKISSPTTSEVVVTTPEIPGLELRIPPNTVIYDHEWKVVTEVSITPIPVERPPFPLPKNVEVPVYYTAQPGGAYLQGSQGARVIYPNYVGELPGARFNFWQYEPTLKGWHIYGQGTVSEDGKQIVPDPGVSIYEFYAPMINSGGNSPPPKGPKCRDSKSCKGADPVDLGTGLFVLEKTDLFLPDILPLALTRTYRQADTNTRPFGIGTTHPYAIFLWSAQQYQEADLVLPDGGRIHYVRISPGTGFSDAEFEHTTTPTIFYKSRLKWNGDGWDLTLKDGTVYVFGENAPLQAIRDRHGNQITITRTNGQSGNITKITSPNGRWIEFTYGAGNRITQAKDNIGRTVSYTYDASGRLIKVTDPNEGITEYTYDSSHRMLTIKDARNIVFLTNEYDASGRVIKQTQADTTTYQMTYSTDASGNIIQTDVTDPRGNVKRVTFNTDGQILTDTRPLGKPEEQTITYEREAGTNLVLSVTDTLNRKTAYSYDATGNVSSITRLAGTPEAVTTSFTYESTFNQVASVTDPLSHTTSFGYDAKGNLTTVTDPLGKQTTLAYNPAGQPISITDPLGNTSQFTYDSGDLVAVTDPLGNSTNRFIDSAGRLVSLTNPLGHTTRYDYDPLNRLVKVTDPFGVTGFGHDPNGNLLSVKDAKDQGTAYTYDSMDRLETRKDPLLRLESYLYDASGNVRQFTDRKGQITTFEYDALNRRTKAIYADGSTTYTYDKGNRLRQVIDSVSGTITRDYDNLDRLTSETTPHGNVSYTYDKAGRRKSMTVVGQLTVNYEYDDANRLTQITQSTSTVTIEYDEVGRRKTLTLPNGVVVEYGYDKASRVTSITYKKDAAVLGGLTYEYDRAGNRTKVGGSFARTGLPQAVSSATYNGANHQLALGDQTMTFDQNGNLTSIGDASGTTIYTWNSRNQLTGISGP